MKRFSAQYVVAALLAVASFVLFVPCALAATPSYAVTDVGDFGATQGSCMPLLLPHNSSAWAINNSGVVVGWSNYYPCDLTFNSLSYSNGALTRLIPASPNGFDSAALAVNDSGEVVGWETVAGTAPNEAFASGSGGTTRLYPFGCPVPIGCSSGATDVNNSGQIVGWYYTPSFPSTLQGFLLSDGVFQDLGSLPGYAPLGAPTAIDEAGDVVGGCSSANTAGNEVSQLRGPPFYIGAATDCRAWLYRDGVLHDLNDLVAGGSGWVLNSASDINNRGQIVGVGTVGGVSHAFLFDLQSGAVADIGSFVPYAINDAGQVVGVANGEAVVERAGVVVDLNSLIPPDSGWHLSGAFGINNHGQIVGEGTSALSGAYVHGFILSDGTPPEAAPTQSPAANAQGWNKSDVTIKWNWSDSGSGVDPANCTMSSVSSGEGTVTVNATCNDLAANSGNATYTAMIDKTAPTVTYSGNAGTYGLLETVAINCNAADGLSGIASSTCANVSAPGWSFGAGPHTVSASASDKADNTGTGSTTFTVTLNSADLCTLTGQFVQSSTKYQALKRIQKKVAKVMVKVGCSFLTSIRPKHKLAQKQAFINAYNQSVQTLVGSGWLTQSQASALNGLAAAL